MRQWDICQEILAENMRPCKDLGNLPLPNWEVTWFPGGLQDGKRRVGAAVVSGTEVIWSSGLPESAQRAELMALTKALELAKGKRATIYTGSPYAFATAHVHGAIYQQRGLLTSAGRQGRSPYFGCSHAS